jgi:hypothetical protein
LRDYQSVVTDISSPLSVRAVKFRQIFNLAGSANEFVNLTEISTDGDIEDCREDPAGGAPARRASRISLAAAPARRAAKDTAGP